MHVGTIMESNDATFFEDIFPMKDMSSSSNQEIPTPSSEEFTVISEPTIAMEHVENTVEGDNGTPVRSKRHTSRKGGNGPGRVSPLVPVQSRTRTNGGIGPGS